MAAVDLIKDAYRQYLGREASDEEAQNWASGAFGHGDANNLDPVLKAIQGSDEARNRGGSGIPSGGGWADVSQPIVREPSDTDWNIGNQPGTSHGYSNNDRGIDDQFWASLNQAYGQYLGRSAKPDEISNWWSGAYGHGSGLSGLGAMQEAIRNSGEARARNNGQVPSAAYQNLDYWAQQGVKDTDIFDPATGKLREGWKSSGKGYERMGGGSSTGTTPNLSINDPFALIKQLTQGRPPTPESLEALAPELAKYGIKLGSKGSRGWTDTIILPDGRMFDIIEAAGIGTGKNWVWQQNGGPGYVSTPEDQYSDPYTKLLEQLLKGRIGQLGQGINDPNRQRNIDALNMRAEQLRSGNAQLSQQMDYLQKRFTDLQGPGYTGAENEVIRTSALDPIEQDRTQAKRMLANQLAAKGHKPGSGVFEQAMLELDKQFNMLRGTTQTQIAGNEISRREGRNQRAEMISSELARIPEERNRELLDVMNAIDRLSALSRSEEDAYAREAIQYGGALSDLGPQRLQLAMQAAGMGGNPSSLGSLLTQIAGLNQNASAYNAQNQNSLWSGLGQLAAIIGRQGQFGLGG